MASLLDKNGHTALSAALSRRSIAKISGELDTIQAPKFVRISVVFIAHGTPGLAQ